MKTTTHPTTRALLTAMFVALVAMVAALFLVSGCDTAAPTYEEGCSEVAERTCTRHEDCFTFGETSRTSTCRADVERQCLRAREPADEFESWPECDAALEELTCDEIYDGAWKFSACYALGAP